MKETQPSKKPGNGSRGGIARGNRSGAATTRPGLKPKPLNSDEAVPMLKYGPFNNFVTFKERIRTACMEKYGDLARLLELEEYWVPDEVDRTRDEYANSDTDEFKKAALIHAIKERTTAISKMKANRSSMFAYILSKLSSESLDELKRYSDYETINESVDPLLLWKAIKKLHMVSTSSKVEQVMKRKAREEYHTCKQGTFESLVDFKARFDTRYEAYKGQGNVELTAEDVAMDFLESLDRARYGEFIVETINDIAKGAMKPPEDINKVYVLANTRLVVKKGAGSYNVGASYATVEHTRPKKGKRTARKKSNGTEGKLLSGAGGVKTDSKSGSDAGKGASNDDKKNKKKLDDVECYNCGKKGHYARNCPENESDESGTDDLAGLTLVEDGMCLVTRSKDTIKYYEIILDSGSQVNIVHPRFLENIREGDGGCKGLFGQGTKLTKVGTLPGFFDCLSSEDTRVSVLSLADVEDLYDVTYKPGCSYTVHMGNTDLDFIRKDKLYVADFSSWIRDDYEECNAMLALMTVDEKLHLYTRKELKGAQLAKEFVKNAGFPSRTEAVHMVRDGNINNIPVSVQDLNTYYDLYGTPVEMLRGKATNKKVNWNSSVDVGLKEQQKVQVMVTDVMYIMKQAFLVSVASPLELTVSCPLSNHTKGCFGDTLQVQINLLRSRGFDVSTIFVDPLKALAALTGHFPGVEVDSTGAGDHLPKVDAKIRRIKENARSIIMGLPYALPRNRVKDLVTYVVNRMNTRRTSALNDNICPRTKFTGRKIDHDREFKLGFGDYVEAYNPKVRSNSMEPRTEPCIALYPAANVTGSWIMWNLVSDSYVRRSNWTKMQMTSTVIDKMNQLAGGKDLVQKADVPPTTVSEPKQSPEGVISVETVTPSEIPSVPTVTNQEAEAEQLEAIDMALSGEDGGEYDEDVPPQPEPTVIRRCERLKNRAPKRDDDFVYSLSQMSVKKGLAKHGDHAKKAIGAEFEQLFKKKKVLKPVCRSSLTESQRRKIIRSSMFLKEKYDGLGRFEKLKGRLVADGRMQDRTLYSDKVSPTAKTESIFAELALAVMKGKLKAKVDIGGAYLNAFVEDGDEIYMELSRELTKILLEIFPMLRKYVDKSGRLLVRILKALYGLVQSAALWYKVLTGYLQDIGFVPNIIDNCVLNNKGNGRDITVVLYVDDLLILSPNQGDIDWLIGKLKHEYKELSTETGDEFNYLGMVLQTNRDGEVTLRMDGYIDNALNAFPEYKNVRKTTTPANVNLFKETETDLLDDKGRKRFHTTVARLLYLSKRVRPDIQLPVLYLCTKVRAPTNEDECKLKRVLGYLKMTKTRGRVITKQGDMTRLNAYVDASFASHADGKGHTGCVIKWGDTTITTVSKKQRIATKDSTEAELVAVSDMTREVEQMNEYLEEQGVNLELPVVYQDNMSTITLVSDERSGNVRTRHLSARRSIVNESIKTRCTLMVKYLPTARMIADVLTKPLGGSLFHKFADAIMGKKRTRADGVSAQGVRCENSSTTGSCDGKQVRTNHHMRNGST
jgi:hypothetical protein